MLKVTILEQITDKGFSVLPENQGENNNNR